MPQVAVAEAPSHFAAAAVAGFLDSSPDPPQAQSSPGSAIENLRYLQSETRGLLFHQHCIIHFNVHWQQTSCLIHCDYVEVNDRTRAKSSSQINVSLMIRTLCFTTAFLLLCADVMNHLVVSDYRHTSVTVVTVVRSYFRMTSCIWHLYSCAVTHIHTHTGKHLCHVLSLSASLAPFEWQSSWVHFIQTIKTAAITTIRRQR